MKTSSMLAGLVVAGLLVAGCGLRDTISGVRDVVSGVRDIAGDLQPMVPVEEGEPPEWTDFPEVERFCGATWTRDEMIAAYEEQGLDGLPQRVGFSGTFLNDIAEFHNRWRVTQVIEATRERRGVVGEPLEELITCIVGTRGAEDPRDAFGVNVLFINDHVRPIERPTLRGVEISLSIVMDDDERSSGEGPAAEQQGPDAEVRWVGACVRNVILPVGGGYVQSRCLLDGPGGLSAEHVDAPEGLPNDCPDPDMSCPGLAYTPSRDVFTEILADPDVRYTFNSGWRSSWSYAD